MGANGTPWVWRCSVTCVITPPPHLAKGTEHNADTPPRPEALSYRDVAAQAQQDARPRDYLCGRTRRCGAGRAAWLRAGRVVRERAGRSLGTTADPASMAPPARSATPWRGSLAGLRDLSTTCSRKWLLSCKPGRFPVSVMIQGGSSSTPGTARVHASATARRAGAVTPEGASYVDGHAG